MDRVGTLPELSRSSAIPHTREDILTTMEATTMEDIRTMEEVHTTTVALRMAMGVEETTIRTVPTPLHPLRRIRVTLPVSNAGRLDTMPPSVLKQRMEMVMEAQGRSQTPLPEVR